TQNIRTILEKNIDLVVIEQKSVSADGAAAEPFFPKVLRRFAEVRVKQRLAEVMEPVNGHLIAGRLIYNFTEETDVHMTNRPRQADGAGAHCAIQIAIISGFDLK